MLISGGYRFPLRARSLGMSGVCGVHTISQAGREFNPTEILGSDNAFFYWDQGGSGRIVCRRRMTVLYSVAISAVGISSGVEVYALKNGVEVGYRERGSPFGTSQPMYAAVPGQVIDVEPGDELSMYALALGAGTLNSVDKTPYMSVYGVQ